MEKAELTRRITEMKEAKARITDLEDRVRQRKDAIGIELEERKIYEQQLSELKEDYIAMITALAKLSSTQQKVIEKHYIEGRSIRDISVEMGYCQRQIGRINKKALEKLGVLLEKMS